VSGGCPKGNLRYRNNIPYTNKVLSKIWVKFNAARLYIRRITNTDSIAIRNYRLRVLAYLVGLAFEDNKRRDNIAVSANYLYNRNSFIAKRLTYLILCYLIIDNKYLLFLALPYIYT
jgi:ascorbate-specific PTS system EIIC-type component UlaA